MSAIVRPVIETHLETRGAGTDEDLMRVITQYWSLDGDLLAEVDPYYPGAPGGYHLALRAVEGAYLTLLGAKPEARIHIQGALCALRAAVAALTGESEERAQCRCEEKARARREGVSP